MTDLNCEPREKLAILRQQDHFRHWQSLDDKRVCVVCDKTFAGHDVIISRESNGYQLRCPTHGCHSHLHQWVYRGNPLISDTAYADWWQALGSSVEQRAQAI